MFEALFSTRGLSLDRLRSFLEMAEAGGIARAAPGDPVRQSQISRQIRELEEFFGTELTQRRGKGLVLTPAARRLAKYPPEFLYPRLPPPQIVRERREIRKQLDEKRPKTPPSSASSPSSPSWTASTQPSLTRFPHSMGPAIP